MELALGQRRAAARARNRGRLDVTGQAAEVEPDSSGLDPAMTGIRTKGLDPRVKPEGDSSVWIFCVSKTEIAPLAVASGEGFEGV